MCTLQKAMEFPSSIFLLRGTSFQSLGIRKQKVWALQKVYWMEVIDP